MAKTEAKYGEWAFLVGVLLSVVLGLVESATTVQLPNYVGPVLVVLGLVVGALNVTAKESHGFLLSTVALMLVASAGLESLPYLGSYLASFLGYLSIFVAPAALLVALKSIYELAKG